MQWVQHPNQNNVDDLINVRREAIRHFRGKRRNSGNLKLMKLKLLVK
jgi:hypothetical protein